ncbi:MAG: hypothetical protein ABJP87_04390 [Bauldia litoralis]|uniref:hypothetical protein n=1 Tax=Bauldia litoralis TaxID=665467 RepID=UPI00329A1686
MKGNNTRQIKTSETGREIEFFFPKHNPPTTIKARNREEAEKKLADLDNHK